MFFSQQNLFWHAYSEVQLAQFM